MAKTDRNKGHYETEHFTKMSRRLAFSPAYQALPCTAKALYIFVKLEWKGPRNNNNGSIRFSTRQAAKRLGVNKDTAMKAFHQLQAKGFLHVTELGMLGVEGYGRGPSYEITEIELPADTTRGGRRLFMKWTPGNDFEILRHTRR